MKLYDTGVYLLNGQKIVPENQADFPVSNCLLYTSDAADE